MNSTIKKEQGSSRALICDLDGTLIEARFYKISSSPRWRSFCGWAISLLPLWFQLKLAKPKLLNLREVKEKQEKKGVEVFIVTARRKRNGSEKKVKTLLEKFGLKIKEENIVMKNGSTNPLDYKKEEFKKIKREYREIEIFEDEEEFYKDLSQLGSIIEIIS